MTCIGSCKGWIPPLMAFGGIQRQGATVPYYISAGSPPTRPYSPIVQIAERMQCFSVNEFLPGYNLDIYIYVNELHIPKSQHQCQST